MSEYLQLFNVKMTLSNQPFLTQSKHDSFGSSDIHTVVGYYATLCKVSPRKQA
jgi:hypothetical protein